jgi:tRNA dimethylallyltransferase
VNKNKFLIVVAGPTAVGKTNLCIALAKALSTEIISFDSRQFYKELSIGTAKPSKEEQGGVFHHFVDSHSIFEEVSSGEFARQAELLVKNLFQTKEVLITTGGSGLYIQAWLDGLDEIPDVLPGMRDRLMQRLQQEGLGALQAELKEFDPEYFSIVDIQNPVRVVRALEVIHSTGKPFSFFRKGEKKQHEFSVVKIMLDREKDELYERINRRMELMLDAGLENEAAAFLAYKHLYALRTVGYQEVFEMLEGEISREEMIEKLKQNSRRYAKRQLTWFRKDPEYTWFHPDQITEILEFIQARIK